ncbi:hypothetical protein J2S42_006682 [Catenuloplanes indicus]|uniref:Uncharacterized protein n=1 Tax=Catenuloplanes indicus TaxID=137267 RepID=A0AAE3W537_9ACTN|nr:hypothetical protein [Catenuloplanes indicus]
MRDGTESRVRQPEAVSGRKLEQRQGLPCASAINRSRTFSSNGLRPVSRIRASPSLSPPTARPGSASSSFGGQGVRSPFGRSRP